MLKISFLAGLFCLALMGSAAASDDLDPVSVKTLHDFQISMAKVEAYDKAYTALSSAAASDPSLQKEIETAGSEKTQSVADEIGKMTRHPKVYAFFEKEGLSKEDATLLLLALTGGCMLAQYPQAAAQIPQASSEQAAFCKANLTKIQKLKFFGGGKQE